MEGEGEGVAAAAAPEVAAEPEAQPAVEPLSEAWFQTVMQCPVGAWPVHGRHIFALDLTAICYASGINCLKRVHYPLASLSIDWQFA